MIMRKPLGGGTKVTWNGLRISRRHLQERSLMYDGESVDMTTLKLNRSIAVESWMRYTKI